MFLQRIQAEKNRRCNFTEKQIEGEDFSGFEQSITYFRNKVHLRNPKGVLSAAHDERCAHPVFRISETAKARQGLLITKADS